MKQRRALERSVIDGFDEGYGWGWRYKNTALLTIGLVLFFLFADNPLIAELIRALGDLGYLGAFIVGIFWTSTFTIAPATVLLYHLAGRLDPIEVALLAGAGAMVGDYLLFRYLKDRVYEELRPVFMKLGKSYLGRLFQTPYFAWLTPLLGALIIASPLPDEAGVGILGLSRLKSWQFLLLSFALNSSGILLIVLLARLGS